MFFTPLLLFSFASFGLHAASYNYTLHTLIQHTPTTTLPSIVAGIFFFLWAFAWYLPVEILPVFYLQLAYVLLILIIFMVTLLFAYSLNVYCICFVAVFFAINAEILRFAMFYTSLLHVHSSAAVVAHYIHHDKLRGLSAQQFRNS